MLQVHAGKILETFVIFPIIFVNVKILGLTA